jgi:predicted component of type VI protein secretion system
MTAVYDRLTEKEKREVRMYGVTEAQMREAVESSITFRFSGPGMMAASILSDVQEMINTEYGEVDYMRAEDARQAINRAKFVLFTYIMDKETA